MAGPPTRNSHLRRDVEHPGRPERGDGGHDRRDVLRDRGVGVEGSNAGTRIRTRSIAARHLRPDGAGRTPKNLLLHYCLTTGHKGQPPGARYGPFTAPSRPHNGHITAPPNGHTTTLCRFPANPPGVKWLFLYRGTGEALAKREMVSGQDLAVKHAHQRFGVHALACAAWPAEAGTPNGLVE